MVGGQKVHYGISETAECQLCLEDDESVIHWITDCPALGYWRINHPLPPNPGWERIKLLSELLLIEEVDEAFNEKIGLTSQSSKPIAEPPIKPRPKLRPTRRRKRKGSTTIVSNRLYQRGRGSINIDPV